MAEQLDRTEVHHAVQHMPFVLDTGETVQVTGVAYGAYDAVRPQWAMNVLATSDRFLFRALVNSILVYELDATMLLQVSGGVVPPLERLETISLGHGAELGPVALVGVDFETINALAVGYFGPTLVVVAVMSQGTVAIVDAEPPFQVLGTVDNDDGESTWSIGVSPRPQPVGQERLVVGANNHRLSIITRNPDAADAGDWLVLQVLEPPFHKHNVPCMAMHPGNARMLASVSIDQHLVLWDLDAQIAVRSRMLEPHLLDQPGWHVRWIARSDIGIVVAPRRRPEAKNRLTPLGAEKDLNEDDIPFRDRAGMDIFDVHSDVLYPAYVDMPPRATDAIESAGDAGSPDEQMLVTCSRTTLYLMDGELRVLAKLRYLFRHLDEAADDPASRAATVEFVPERSLIAIAAASIVIVRVACVIEPTAAFSNFSLTRVARVDIASPLRHGVARTTCAGLAVVRRNGRVYLVAISLFGDVQFFQLDTVRARCRTERLQNGILFGDSSIL